MRKPIQLGLTEFSTKGAAQQQVKSILNSSLLGVALEGKSFDIINALLNRHPKASEKISSGVKSITVEDNGLASSRCFMVNRTDGSCIDFSYIRCFDGSLPQDIKFKKACRRSVAKNTVAFREEQFGDKTVNIKGAKSAISGEILSYENCHVDHTKPSFNQIVEEFIAYYKIDVNQIETVELDKLIGSCAFVDPQLTEEFRAWHKERARLRLITIEEHKAVHGSEGASA